MATSPAVHTKHNQSNMHPDCLLLPIGHLLQSQHMHYGLVLEFLADNQSSNY